MARRKPAFDPEDFDLQGEMESGLVISDTRHGHYDIVLEGKHVETAGSMEEAILSALLFMEKNQYWPNVFYVNERGNTDLLVITPKKRKDKIIGATSSIVASWV